MTSRLKQLVKDSLIYGIGGVLARAISFLLLPIYTRIFTPADYGTIEMMMVIVSFLSAFLVMGMDSAQSFYFFDQKKNGSQKQKIVVSAILQWNLIWGSGVIIVVTFLAPLLNDWFFRGGLSNAYFALAFSGALFAVVMTQSVEIFRLLYRPWAYVGVTITNTILSAVITLSLVLILNKGILGYFIGSTVSALFVSLFGWYLARQYLDLSKWHFDWWPKLIKFGAPMLPAGVAFYAMSTADRWFIQYYHGAEALGLFAVGAKFALIMALVIETFRKAWWPMAMDAMHSDDGPETFRMIARLFMGVGVAAVVYLTFLSSWLLQWMTGEAFHQAHSLVGVLAWQSLFYGFFLVGSAGLWKAEKTYITTFLMGGAGLINVLLNYLWVPDYGGMGAACATAVSYLLWNLITLLISERYWKVEFPILLMLFQIILGGLVGYVLILGDMSVFHSALITHVAVMLLLLSALDINNWNRLLLKARRITVFVN
jgi:O-antigen/teichoic acid export membrane protein